MVNGLESGRTGCGIVVFLILPLTIVGAVSKGVRDRAMTTIILLAVIFFTVWFFSGTTQRARHLLPVYPLILLAGYALACNAGRRYRLMPAVAVSVGLAIFIQLGGQGLFALNYARYVFSDETRADFLQRNIASADAVLWINKNLRNTERVAYSYRELGYLFEVPAFMIHPHLQALVDFREEAGNGGQFVAQSKRQGLTHFLLNTSSLRSTPSNNIPRVRMMEKLLEAGCLKRAMSFKHRSISSRTLAQISGPNESGTMELYKFEPDGCQEKSIGSVGTGSSH
jgi:hypothetical protein